MASDLMAHLFACMQLFRTEVPSNVQNNPLRLMKKQRRLTVRRNWQAYAKLFDSRCQRKHVDKEWWDTVLIKIHNFLSLLDADVNRYYHQPNTY